MTKLIHQEGDIFYTTARGIGHGINVDGAMASGIAVQFRDRFRSMHNQYRELCRVGAIEPGSIFAYEAGEHYGRALYVYNIASQDRPGRNARLEWIESGVREALAHAASVGIDRIALPRIGSGIGGLNQDEVEAILDRLAKESPVDIELWTYVR